MNSYYNKTAASVETFLEQIRQRNTKSNRTIIYRALLNAPNSTKNELIKSTGLIHQTLTSQLSVLMDLGIVEVTGGKKSIGSTCSV